MTVSRPQPRINAIATAVPESECNDRYGAWARRQLGEREGVLLERMLQRGGIGNRYTVLTEDDTHEAAGSFYARNEPPGTLDRMKVYAREAPELALAAIGKLGDPSEVTHLVVASCTGFMAPSMPEPRRRA